MHWYVPKHGGVFYWSFHDALINYLMRILQKASSVCCWTSLCLSLEPVIPYLLGTRPSLQCSISRSSKETSLGVKLCRLVESPRHSLWNAILSSSSLALGIFAIYSFSCNISRSVTSPVKSLKVSLISDTINKPPFTCLFILCFYK